GLSWCVINNPLPDKVISTIKIQSPEDNGIYTVLGITLANHEHYVPVKPTSFGGPDNWAASTAMAALAEGLAGVQNAEGAQAYTTANVAPRWITTQSDSVKVCIRYAASKAYVAYQYHHEKNKKQIRLLLTGSGKKIEAHILLPDAAKEAVSVLKDGKPIGFKNTVSAEGARYADVGMENNAPSKLTVLYN
ncbi:MAG: MliC family protein, partial [Rhizobacter sp.]|nr:MliC family protein [Ferruginibacter sp.]